MRSIVLFRVSRRCVGLYEWGVYRIHRGEFGDCDSSRTVGCVCGGGESYIDEPLVSTVILPQIGELPVHLSLGEVLL